MSRFKINDNIKTFTFPREPDGIYIQKDDKEGVTVMKLTFEELKAIYDLVFSDNKKENE